MSNRFTESIIREAKQALGEDFWGFLMLGGMSGGGMAFFVAPHRKAAFLDEAGAIMRRVKATLDDALPFAMEPVVYDFRINPHGTFAELAVDADAMMPPALLHAPGPPDDRRGDGQRSTRSGSRTSTTSPTTPRTPASCSASSGR